MKRNREKMGVVLALGVFIGALGVSLLRSEGAKAVKEFTIINEEHPGYENAAQKIKTGPTRRWGPSVIIVHKGDKVKIKLINNVASDPNLHGFHIETFGVQAEVIRGKPKTVEFVASRAGIFPYTCHLHPAHVGGQLLVLK